MKGGILSEMKKISEKIKEYKSLIIVAIIFIVICLGMLIFTQIKSTENVNATNVTQYFETPDRIVYKKKEKDEYYVFNPYEEGYRNIIQQLTRCIGNFEGNSNITEQELKQMENEENYIELDYNTISKNYVIFYEKDNLNVIKRTNSGGTLVKSSINEKEQLKQLIEKEIQNKQYYQMSDNKEYKIENEVSIDKVEKNTQLKKYETGVYGIKAQNIQTLNDIIAQYELQLEENIPEDVFNKADVIVLFSKWDISKIETRIGGITYYFTGNSRFNTYIPDIFVASKAINTNCIYRNFSMANTYVSKTLSGIITEIEENTVFIQDDNQEVQQVLIKGNAIIKNGRTQKDMSFKEIKVNDKISIDNVEYSENKLQTKEGTTIQVIRNIHGEKLKKELLSIPEIQADIESINNTGKSIILNCKLRDWYYTNDYQKAETVDVQIIVEKDTTVLGSTENQLEVLEEMMQRDNTIYVTLKQNQSGTLVAENIEQMGC